MKLITKNQYLLFLQDKKTLDQVKGFIFAELDDQRANNEAFRERDWEIRLQVTKARILREAKMQVGGSSKHNSEIDGDRVPGNKKLGSWDK